MERLILLNVKGSEFGSWWAGQHFYLVKVLLFFFASIYFNQASLKTQNNYATFDFTLSLKLFRK